jgi:AraC-like DNA-binding protein
MIKVTSSKKGFLAGSLILIAILILAISGGMYVEFRSVMLREAANRYQSQLRQLESSLGMLVQYVNDAISHISYDADLMDYISYLESANLIRIYRINQRIESLVTFQEGIDAIHVYYKDKGKVLSYFRGLIDAAEFADQQALTYSDDFFLKPGWTKPRLIPLDRFQRFSESKGISIIRPFQGTMVGSSDIFLIVNLDWRYIENLATSLGFGSANPVLYHSAANEMIPLVSLPLGFLDTFDDSAYLVLDYATSLGGEFISYVRKSDLTAGIRRTMVILISLAIVTFLVGIVMFMLISAPMLNAMDGLALLFHTKDLDEVVRNAHSLLVNKQTADEELRNSEGADASYALLQLLDAGFTESEATSLLKKQGIAFPFDRGFACAVLECQTNPVGQVEQGWKHALVETLEASSDIPFIKISPSSHQLVLILSCDGQNACQQLLAALMAGLPADHQAAAALRCGVAFSKHGYADLSGCYVKATNSLKTHFQYPQRRMFIHEDDGVSSNSLMYSIMDHLPTLAQRKLDADSLDRFKKDLYEFIRVLEAAPPLHPENIRFLIVRILLNLQEVVPPAWTCGFDTVKLELFDAPDLHQAVKCLSDYCERLEVMASGNEKDPGQIIVDKTRAFIMGNLDRDLSIKRIGEEVFMSRSHLSRLFYLKTGIMLKDFITQARMNEACRLLKDTRGQIQAVGRAVGYPNTQSFIRSFKDSLGCTPGDYRQQQAHQSISCLE